jgi:hypothetical protein
MATGRERRVRGAPRSNRFILGWLGVAACAVVVIGGGLLWRAYDEMGSGARASLAKAYQDVRPERLGTVSFDRSAGSGRFSDNAPTRNLGVVVASPDPIAVRSQVDSLIEATGFERLHGAPRELISFENGEPQPSGYWQRKKDGNISAIIDVYLYPGGSRFARGTQRIPEGSTGVLLYFVGTG